MNQYTFIPNKNSNGKINHSIIIYANDELQACSILHTITTGSYSLIAAIKKES